MLPVSDSSHRIYLFLKVLKNVHEYIPHTDTLGIPLYIYKLAQGVKPTVRKFQSSASPGCRVIREIRCDKAPAKHSRFVFCQVCVCVYVQ